MSDTPHRVKRSIVNAMSPEDKLRVSILEALGRWRIVDDEPAAVVK
jgi:hypothetical protein